MRKMLSYIMEIMDFTINSNKRGLPIIRVANSAPFLTRFGALFCALVGLGEGQGFAQTTQYSIGDPSPEEQLSLELINRARANPAAEGIRLAAQARAEVSIYVDLVYFSTSLNRMQQEMAAIPAAPPLTFNSILLGTARQHSQFMLTRNLQTHFQTGASTYYWDRMDNAGYEWSEAAENIFATTINPAEAHASFEIDWGSGFAGMQDGRGHRGRIHSWKYREIGIGWKAGSGSKVGPHAVTHNFGERLSRSEIKPYITGVAIYDADGDDFYDIGEGIGDVRVTVDRSSGASLVRHDKFALTTGAGGYSIPVDSAGDYVVNFEVPGMPVHSIPVSVVSQTIPGTSTPVLTNRKVDLVLQEDSVPAYTPPEIHEELQMVEGMTTLVDFDHTAASLEYEVVVADFNPNPTEQDADASAAVSTSKSSGYSLIGSPHDQGDRLAFHLAHLSSGSGHQSMTLERVFVPGDTASISFDSQLGLAGTGQVATLQVTADDGGSWTDLWFKQGNNAFGNRMSLVTVDVSQFVQQQVKFRFLYYIGGGGVRSGAGSSYGWHFDDIGFTGMTELIAKDSSSVAASEYLFTPRSPGDYHVQVRARAGDVFLPYAAASVVEVTSNDYTGWAARMERAKGLAAGTLSDSSADYDGDGLSQLAEYALEASGLDPAKADPMMIPAAEIEEETLCVHYKVDTERRDISIGVEVTTNLQDWYSPGEAGAPAGFVDYTTGGAVGAIEDRTAEVPVGAHQTLFLRLKISELSSQ